VAVLNKTFSRDIIVFYMFRFHELIAKYYETEGAAVFASTDYMMKTPSWAVYGRY
jgi:hypothetical protein